MQRCCAGFAIIGCLLGATLPARAAIRFASVEILRPLFAHLLGSPPEMRMDVVPDVYEGGYARISVYAQGASVGGIRIDELWIRLVGASLDPAALSEGTVKIWQVRDSAIYGRLTLSSLERFLNEQGNITDVRITRREDAVVATGVLRFNGVPARVSVRGLFQVFGEPEIRFHIDALSVNGLPMPFVIVDKLERQMNPVVDFRSWPVPFKIRSLRPTGQGFVLSTQRDFAQPCNDCGGPELRLTP